MKKNNIKTVNFIAMLMLAVTYIAAIASGTFGVNFSDAAARIIGIMTLTALPAAAFTTVKIKRTENQ